MVSGNECVVGCFGAFVGVWGSLGEMGARMRWVARARLAWEDG